MKMTVSGLVNEGFILDETSAWKLDHVPENDKGFAAKARGKQKPSKHESGYRNLLRGTQRRDVIMKILGLSLSAAAGCIVPVAMLVYSESVEMMMAREHPNPEGFSPQLLLTKTFGGGGRVLPGNASREEQMNALQDDIASMNSIVLYFNLVQMIAATCGVALLKMAASNQAGRIRRQLFKAAMRHDMTWFDMNSGHNLAANFNEEIAHIENGVGSAIAIMTMYLFNVLSGAFMCACVSWRLTLAIGSLIPLDLALVFLISHFQNGVAAKETEASAKAGNIFTEAISKIRTVLLFGGEDKEVAKYKKMLTMTSGYSMKRGIFHGSAMSITWIFNYLTCIVAFVYGAYLMQHGEQLSAISMVLSNAWIMTVRFGASFSLLQKVTTAASSAFFVFRTIDGKHGIDPLAEGGVTLNSLSGKIQFRNVHFCYPSRPQVPVLNGVNFFIRPGETVAIVGPSGTGKSTVLQLLQRFYDTQSGSVEIEGVDVKMQNVRWMRQQMAVVGQEASLFAGSIWENIRFGLMSASDEQIISAAKLANAHDFITKLHHGYDTIIGSKGATLSGGEKQRIAIARALVRNPRILLLDEPTSALDANSRDIVHAALRTACKGRTTLIVTHRLASTKSADRIIVLDGGKVVEDGTHTELLALNGIYKQLSLSEDKLEKSAAKPAAFEKSSTLKLDVEESQSVSEEKDVLAEEQEVSVPRSIFLRWNRPEKWVLLGGILASAVSGTMNCLGAVVYGEFIGSFAHTDLNEVQKQVWFFSGIEIAIMVAMSASVFLVVYLFTAARERLTNRLKLAAFTSIMKQESGWFDDARNHVGALYTRVSRDVLLIQDFTGPGIGTYIQAIFNLAVGFGISMYYSWKLTLATELVIPILFIAPVLDGIMSKKEDSLEIDHLAAASAFAAEALSNKNVITSLGLERVMIARYNAALLRSDWRSKISAITRGIAFGITEAVPGLAFAFCFFYGAILMRDEQLPFQEVVKLSEILLVGAWTVCSEVAFTTSFSTARQAASRIQYLLTRTSSIQDGSLTDIMPTKDSTADIRYSDVTMAYPTRPETKVLQELNLDIAEGDNVAVVGASGCGKSSILHLLQRLYDPSAGRISLHGTHIHDLAIPTLRHHLGHVSQEPSLFSGSIRENIAYGDNTRNIPMEEIIAAAKKANIHNFIAELPAGYETVLGEHAQLSGGQKQRIAIARALVRDPKILLLDEATSALDPESERVVQEALNLAAKGRTTITIAHRLGALAHSNRILRLEAGRILEEKLQIKL